MANETSNYKINKYGKEAIQPVIEELSDLCRVYHIPMFATIAIEDNESGTEYQNVVYNAKSHDITLNDDKIRRHMLIADGFEAVPPREVVTFDPLGVLDDDQS